MKKYSFLFAFFMCLYSFSQNYKGNLSSVEKSGLHKTLLTPQIRAASSNNFNFIRIIDSLAQEVPYVLKQPSDRRFSNYTSIKIASNKRIKRKENALTAIIIENKTGKKQARLSLIVANNQLTKKYNIFGSDTGKQWFGISSNQRISFRNAADKSYVEKHINFPVNKYRFLKIEFNDTNSLPINVLGIGVYKSQFFSETPIVLKNYNQETIQLKEKKVTRLFFEAKISHKITAISFDVNTDYFLRSAKIIVKKERKLKKRVVKYEDVIAVFQLNSKNQNTFNFKDLEEKEFIIEIDNQDNPPLNIAEITLLQKPVYLISNLKKNKSYKMLIDTSYKKPSYDLGNFISDTALTIKEATITNFSKVEQQKAIAAEKSFWETQLFMWLCIVLVGIFVVYVAFSLLKDISAQKEV